MEPPITWYEVLGDFFGPMPVDGLVIDQSPKAPGKLRRHGTVTARVWHPPVRLQGPSQGPFHGPFRGPGR